MAIFPEDKIEDIDSINEKQRKNRWDDYKIYDDYVRSLDEIIDENKELSIEELLMKMCEQSAHLYRGQHITHFRLQKFYDDLQEKLSDKNTLLNDKTSLYVASIETAISVSSIAYPPLAGVRYGFETINGALERKNSAATQIASHLYERGSTISRLHREGMQKADTNWKTTEEIMNRAITSAERLAQTIVSN